MSDTAGIGPAGEDFIIAEEVSSEAVYRAQSAVPTWPGGASGITIGIGYDIGTTSEAQFRADWDALLPPAWITRLARCCGIQGDRAKPMAADLRDIQVDYQAALRVFRTRSIPQVTAALLRCIPQAAILAPPCRAALVSLAYNRGNAWHAQDDRHREMRDIASAIGEGHADAVPNLIRAMKRLWVQNPADPPEDWRPLPNMAGLLARRDREADMFTAGLGTWAAPPATAPAPRIPAPATGDGPLERSAEGR